MWVIPFGRLSVFLFYEYTLSLYTTQQQSISNLQASKPPRRERKNTHLQCVFAKRRRGSRPKGSNFFLGECYKFRIMKTFTDIILHIPHSSARFEANDLMKWKGDIESSIRRLTDWHTDKLFASTIAGVHTMVFDYNRFYCDVERLENDPMEEIGQGIVYRRFANCERCLTEDEVNKIYNIYSEWHHKLVDLCAMCDFPLIIDCHSFPTDMAEDVDICIGFNDDWSFPGKELIDEVAQLFRDAGYRVAFNMPYSNSMIPQYDNLRNCKSMMIEVNKRVYLEADNITLSVGLQRINELLNKLYKILLQ